MSKMIEHAINQLVIYCDVEHAYNFYYLTGFYTRFEEALLILDQQGKAVLMLGNENLDKVNKARIEATAVHCSLFSLPNQPNRNDLDFVSLLRQTGIKEGQKVGVVGWKYFTSPIDTNVMFDVPIISWRESEELLEMMNSSPMKQVCSLVKMVCEQLIMPMKLLIMSMGQCLHRIPF